MSDEYNGPDYAALDLPEDKPKPEWHYSRRKAYIYRELMDRGHHRLLNKTELAAEFDVTRQTIYRDLDAIAEYVEATMAKNHASETVQVFQRCVQELLDEGEYKKAADVQSQFGEWLERRGAIDTEPEKHEVTWRDYIE